ERVFLVDLALRAGVAEHHTLVAGAFVLFALFLFGIDPHGNVGRLAVQQHFDVGTMIRKAALIVADVLDNPAGDLGDQLAIDNRRSVDPPEQLTATLAGDHDLVGRAEGFTAEPRIDQAVLSNAELDVPLDKGVEDCVRYLVANLVRVSLRHGFAGKKVVCASHETLPPRLSTAAVRAKAATAVSAGKAKRRCSKGCCRVVQPRSRCGRKVGVRIAAPNARTAGLPLLARGNLLNEIDDAPPQFGIVDPHE